MQLGPSSGRQGSGRPPALVPRGQAAKISTGNLRWACGHHFFGQVRAQCGGAHIAGQVPSTQNGARLGRARARLPRALSRPRRPGSHWPVDCGRSPAPLWTDCSDPWLEQVSGRGARCQGARAPSPVPRVSWQAWEWESGRVRTMMRPTRIQSALFSSELPHPVAVAVAAVQCSVEAGRTGRRKQEADAPFPAVNPCGGACLTLAPSPPPISPSLPRLPSGRSLSPSRRVLSRILYSCKELEERRYSPLLISCAEKKHNAPIPSDSSPRPNPDTVPWLTRTRKSAPSPLGVSSFQFPEARPADRAPCPPASPPGLLALPCPSPAAHPSIPIHRIPPSLPHLPLACATLVTCSAHHRLTRHSIPGQRSPHLIKHAPSLEHRVHLRRQP